MFHTAQARDILEGRITDVYFERTLRILKAKNVDKNVKAEFIAKGLPEARPWAVLAGLEEALGLLENLPVNVRSMQEGTVFHPYEPVLEIEGMYQDFCVYETALLGLLCQASGIATQAARFKKRAGERLLLSFGARRMHPVLAPMIERNAYIGGCDGVSVVKSGEVIGEEPMGTMPHALIICFGSTLAAVRAYEEVISPGEKMTALIDTFQDEKTECIALAEALRTKLSAVRFDTPSSRRGNFYRILEEARWELDLRGYGHVKFFVSGGIKEEDIPALNPLVHGYGVGTSISNAPVIDFSMDIVEVEGAPIAKRGKWSGSKRVLECPACRRREIVPYRAPQSSNQCPCGGLLSDILVPILDHGTKMLKPVTASVLRRRVLDNVKDLPL